MTFPDGLAIVRRVLADEASVVDTLLPQTPLAGLTAAPIFVGEYPRLEAGLGATDPRSYDWTSLLKDRRVRLLVISAAGRPSSPADESRAPWGRIRFDVLSYAPTFGAAAGPHWAAYAFLKDLSRVRAQLSAGVGLLHDVTVEGGPIQFTDPDTDAPVMVGTYAASVAEEFVSVA